MYCVDYLSTECNENLLNCIANLDENSPTFEGNKCLVTDVIEVISVVIEAAVLAGRFLHKP
jgi:secretory phospholipase A2